MTENALKEKLENTLIRKTFHISGMPEALWKDVDSFCKEHYADCRWIMMKDLMEQTKRDWKYEVIYDEIQAIKAELMKPEPEPEAGTVIARKPKTFGKQE